MFGRLRESLGKSRRALTEQLQVAAFDPDDDASWERLEEALIYADVGVRATAELIRRLEARQDLTELQAALAEEIAALFGRAADARRRTTSPPSSSSSVSTAPARRRRSASSRSGCGRAAAR